MFRDMHVLLTGASTGIGEGFARAMSRRGWRLSLVARRKDELERVAASLADRAACRILPADVSRLEDLEGLVRDAEAGLGPIDVLVNNAGIEIIGSTLEVPIADGEKLLAVNLLAPLRLIQLVAPGMAKRRHGTLVNVTSLAGVFGQPYGMHYGTSKAALSAASEHLRHELAPDGIRVLTVYPGPIVTAMGQRAISRYETDPLPSFCWGTVDSLSDHLMSALDRDCARIVHPRFMLPLTWFPGLVRWAAARLSPPPRRDHSPK